MKIVNSVPPNYSNIQRIIDPPKDAVFPYGNILYNPSGEEIPPDIQYHENTHCHRQKKYPSPELWWQKWLLDKEFRLEEELIAFSAQLKFIKQFYPNKAVKEALEEMAENLSTNYKLDLNKHEAATLIRKYDNK